MNRVGIVTLYCLTLLLTTVGQAQPVDPDPLRFQITQLIAGSDDLIAADSGAVTGGDWVQVFADPLRNLLLASTQSDSTGAVDPFSIGDGATVDGVIINNQIENSVYLFAWDGEEWSDGHVTLRNDVLGPVLLHAATFDRDSDGSLDQARLIFNEAIVDSAAADSVVLANLAIADSSCTTFDTGDTADDPGCDFLINDEDLESTGTGAALIQYSDTASGGIIDTLGNEALDFSLAADDLARPLISLCSYRDLNQDGTVETVVINWSEEVTFSWDAGDWELSGNQDLQLQFDNWQHMADSTIIEVTADSLETGCDENGDPQLSYTNNADRIQDLAPLPNSALSDTVSIADRAPPHCYDAYYFCSDWSSFNYVDRFNLLWTENIHPDAAGDYWSMIADDLNLQITAIVWVDSTDRLQFTTTGDENETGSSTTEPQVSFGGLDQLRDSAGNVPAYTGSLLRDLALPQQYHLIYLDDNIDGTVETIRIEYSEEIAFTWQPADWELYNNLDLNLQITATELQGGALLFSVVGDSSETGCNNNGNPLLSYTNHDDLIYDLSPQANVAPSTDPTEVADGAAPFCRWDGRYTDVNASGTVDRADIHLTEDLYGFTFNPEDWGMAGGDINLVINFAVVVSHGNILFAVEGDYCETGVDNESGVEPAITYVPNEPLILHDEVGNSCLGFTRELRDEANPVIADCSFHPLNYSDDDHDGQVDHVNVFFTEQVFCDTLGELWDLEFPSIESNPQPTLLEGSGTIQLGLTGFDMPENLTFLEDATLALTSGTAVTDNNGNLFNSFPASPLFDMAQPVAFAVTPAQDPILLQERQQLEILFSELMLDDGSSDPMVSYLTGGPVQRDVSCSTLPLWDTYQHPQFPAVLQSWFRVDANDLIRLGETGTALVMISDAVDLSENVMPDSPPSPQEFTFVIDARALILVTEPDATEIEAGMEFMLQVQAMDSSASQTDLFYNESLLFSSNLDPEQIELPEGPQLLENGQGAFPITVLGPAEELYLYVEEEGGRINNSGHGEGPYDVYAPVIDAPHAGWSNDTPDDQGNFIDFYCELSANDPASDEYDPEVVGLNVVREYRWYRDEGEFLTLVAQTVQQDSIELVYEHFDTGGDTTTWTYYVAAWSDGGGSRTTDADGGGNLRREFVKGSVDRGDYRLFERIGHPQAEIGDRIRVRVPGRPELIEREGDYSSTVIHAGVSRCYDNIPPQPVEQFTVTRQDTYDLQFDWIPVTHGVNDSLEINPVYYHLYRGTSVTAIDELIYASTEVEWTDVDVVGNPEANYFYRISAHDWDNESELSLILGEYDYHVRSAEGTDWNFIGLSMQTDLATASELVEHITGCNGASDWVAEHQGWDTWAPLRSDFPLTMGHAYLVNCPEGETVYTVIGEPVLGMNFQLLTTTTTDWNDITLPLEQTDVTSLGDLVEAVPEADAAAYFDNQAQSWYVFYEEFPPEWDRNVVPGQALLVNVTSPATWPDNSVGRTLGELLAENSTSTAPHLVWGELYSEDGSRAGNETTVTAWVVGREGDLQTGTTVRLQDGIFALQLADFTHPWRAGEVVRFEFEDETGAVSSCETTLSWGGADYAGAVTLAQLPASWVLYQNYPNPFNPATVIPFDLPEQSRVELAVFDLLGQQVTLLKQGQLPAGHHEVTWDGCNRQGHQVASGIYFVRMQAGDYTGFIKLAKVK